MAISNRVAPVAAPGRAQWTEVLPYRPAVRLDSADAFAGHLAVWEREAGLRQLRILDLGAGSEHTVAFPEPVGFFTQFGVGEGLEGALQGIDGIGIVPQLP